MSLLKLALGVVRFLLFLVALLFFGCSSSHRQWTSDQPFRSFTRSNSQRIFLKPVDPYRGLEIELVRGSYGIRVYVNALCFCFPPLKDNPKKAVLQLFMNGEWEEGEATLFEGGQRLLLPVEMKEKMVEALSRGETVQLKIGRFSEQIVPTHFLPSYNQL